MRQDHLVFVVLSALSLAAPPRGSAQEAVCSQTETVGACATRLQTEARTLPSASAAAARGDQEAELQKKATGSNLAENLAQSAIRDFLPRFAGTLLTSDPTNDVRALDLRFNAPMRRAGAPGFTLQGGVTLHKAELYGPLVDSIPESIRDASRKRLQDELEDGDDATAFASLNVESHRLGRDFASQRDVIDRFAAAVAAEADRVTHDRAQEITVEFGRFSGKLGQPGSLDPTRLNDPRCVDPRGNPLQAGRLAVGCLTGDFQKALEALLVPLARAQAMRLIAMERVLTDNGFDRLADLVNNQPQLNLSAEYRNRVGVVGPNEWAGRVRFETGFANMNGLRRHCARGDSAGPADTAAAAGRLTLACLRGYTHSPGVTRSLDRSDRLWFEGEVRYRPAYHVVLKEDSLDFTLGSGVGFGVSGGYGRYLGRAGAKKDDRDRIDLHASYDYADGEDLRQSRFLAGVFYTLKVSGNVQGVVGLAWANKPEFLDGADRRLHANLGLSYKFNRGKSEQ